MLAARSSVKSVAQHSEPRRPSRDVPTSWYFACPSAWCCAAARGGHNGEGSTGAAELPHCRHLRSYGALNAQDIEVYKSWYFTHSFTLCFAATHRHELHRSLEQVISSLRAPLRYDGALRHHSVKETTRSTLSSRK